jgi:hypothetical protein
MIATTLSTRILTGFDDPALGAEPWERLLARGDTDNEEPNGGRRAAAGWS